MRFRLGSMKCCISDFVNACQFTATTFDHRPLGNCTRCALWTSPLFQKKPLLLRSNGELLATTYELQATSYELRAKSY
mgnify:CR=1 FL=1